MQLPSDPAAERQRVLADVLGLTEAAERAVEAGEWRRAASLDAERRTLLERLLSARERPADDLARALSEVRASNDRILTSVARERQGLLDEAADLRRQRRAAAEYGQAERADR